MELNKFYRTKSKQNKTKKFAYFGFLFTDFSNPLPFKQLTIIKYLSQILRSPPQLKSESILSVRGENRIACHP